MPRLRLGFTDEEKNHIAWRILCGFRITSNKAFDIEFIPVIFLYNIALGLSPLFHLIEQLLLQKLGILYVFSLFQTLVSKDLLVLQLSSFFRMLIIKQLTTVNIA